MLIGTLDIKLRPIKIAFLVDIKETGSILEAIRINSLLWGGNYNPIIPIYERKPKYLAKDILFKREKNEDIIEGYLDAYDPDYVIPLGKCSGKSISTGDYEKANKNEILANLEGGGTVGYGISIYEVLGELYEKELKFLRKRPLRFLIPQLPKRNHLFFASIFGELPERQEKDLVDKYTDALSLEFPKCKISNYTDFLGQNNLFIRRITGRNIEVLGHGGMDTNYLYLLDATSNLDIIDYWNLRALGLPVYPIAKQTYKTNGVIKFARSIVDNGFIRSRFNPEIYYSTTLQKGRSVSETETDEFLRALDIKRDEATGHPKLIVRNWYPRIWDDWARDKDSASPCELSAETSQINLSGNLENISFKVVAPQFMAPYGNSGKPRYANEIELRTYGSTNLVAEVMPRGNEELADRIGGFGYKEWRLSNKGLVYLSHYNKWTAHLPLPEAEFVFFSWLKYLGWEAKLSPSGYIGKQLIKQLGGIIGISALANEGLLNLLGRLTGQTKGFTKLTSELNNLKKILLKNGSEEASSKVEEFINKLEDAEAVPKLKKDPPSYVGLLSEISKAISKDKYDRDPVRYLHRLIEVKMFRLGVSIKCPSCQVTSWYALNELKYELTCPSCLESFITPVHSPNQEMVWSYNTHGPFSLPNYAHGNYTVLLSLRFFSRLLDGAVTPSMSFILKKGKKEIEVDLGLLFSMSKFFNSTVIPVFCECKSFWDKLDEKCVRNLEYIGKEIPGSVLVFSTLRKTLDRSEIRLLTSLVSRNRRNRRTQKPFNHIMILTGTELFSEFGPPECWKNGNSEHRAFAKSYSRYQGLDELCDVTQQIYLKIKPWYEDVRKHTEDKLAKRNLINPASVTT